MISERSIAGACSHELKPGLHRLALPLEGHSIGHVNVYALESDEGLLLVDCGWSTPEARAALERLVAGIGYGMHQIKTVLLTHSHVDHCGLAGWLQGFGARIGINEMEAVQLESRYIHQAPYLDATDRWLSWAGVPDKLWDGAREQVPVQKTRFWPGVPDFLLGAGSAVSHGSFRLEVMHTPGHTPGSLSFYESSTASLFTGDTLFARSTYSPTLRPFASADPMSDYLMSIEQYPRLDVELVLPGHQQPFAGVTSRVQKVRDHHLARARDIGRASRSSGGTAWEVAAGLSRRRPWQSLSLGLQLSSTGEVCAHLKRLARLGVIGEHTGTPTIWGPSGLIADGQDAAGLGL